MEWEFCQALYTHFDLRVSVPPRCNSLYLSQLILKRHYLIQLQKAAHFSDVTLRREGGKDLQLSNAITVDYKVRVFM